MDEILAFYSHVYTIFKVKIYIECMVYVTTFPMTTFCLLSIIGRSVLYIDYSSNRSSIFL